MDKALLVAVYIFLGLVPLAELQTFRCPKGLKRNKYLKVFRKKCYYFEHSETSWYAALGICHKHGGTLVHIRDQATQYFVYSSLLQLKWSRNGVWIGARDYRENNEWEWADTSIPVGPYHNWDDGQPSCSSVGCYETCGLLRTDSGGKWHDKRCSGAFVTYSYICMYDFRSLPTTTSSTTTSTTTTTTTTTTAKSTTTKATTTRTETTRTKSTSFAATNSTTAVSNHSTRSPSPYVDPNKQERQHKPPVTTVPVAAAVAGSIVTILLVIFVIIFIVLAINRRRRKRESLSRGFPNPVYGDPTRPPVVFYRPDPAQRANRQNMANDQRLNGYINTDCDALNSDTKLACSTYQNEEIVNKEDGYATCMDMYESDDKIYQDIIEIQDQFVDDDAKLSDYKCTDEDKEDDAYLRAGDACSRGNVYVDVNAVSNKTYSG